ncbi:MAG TPA: hypothetical protein PKD26_01125 [Pyrinomonadaceae bacterium]|nr:hypothetical protein [Pyrinomonadaceae bacterium]
MNNGPNDILDETDEKHPIKDHISGLGQKIIGGIEEIGGILTGDPVTAAEGEFNVEVGEVREEIEEELEETPEPSRGDGEGRE